MKPKHLVTIIIPIYSSTLTRLEKISLIQCLEVLSNYPIIFISPQNLSLDPDLERMIAGFQKEFFAKEYFVNKLSYNKLLLSKEFYERFISYKFILIHQLDAFVFRDDLQTWCKKNYAYVGAPWRNIDWIKPEIIFSEWFYKLQKWFGIKIKIEDRLVGNGGMSLRKVKSHLLAIYLLRSKAWFWNDNEDIFWGMVVPGYLPFFTVPNLSIAIKFAFELDPAKCYELNEQQLPFGCHAWWTYDLEFWRPHIERLGYKLD